MLGGCLDYNYMYFCTALDNFAISHSLPLRLVRSGMPAAFSIVSSIEVAA